MKSGFQNDFFVGLMNEHEFDDDEGLGCVGEDDDVSAYYAVGG